VETVRRHPLYKKAVKRTKRYKVNDEGNVCKVGDKVKIVETRPLSKEKRWQMVEIISRGELSEIESVGSGEK